MTRTTPRALALLACALLLSLVPACGPREPGLGGEGEGTLLFGPRFWTGDPARPWAEGLVVEQGRINALATADEVRELAGAGMVLVELPGEVALPGLVDAHAHILGYGVALRRVQLAGSQTLDEALERVARYAEQHPDDPWILGRGWDQNDWPGSAWPTADRLDQVISKRPVALRRIDGHAMWVNRTALAAAGIDANTPDPPGGRIHRDASGRPTGILIDTAMELVGDVIPELSDAQIREALELAADDLVSQGLTGVHDMGMSARAWAAIASLTKSGRFPLRVNAYASDDDPLFETLLVEGPQLSGALRALGPKLYADGALGSRGARLLEPYSDEPGALGLWVTEPQQLEASVRRAFEAGLQPAIHAIGDAANRAVLDIYERALADSALPGDGLSPSLRPRVEHAQIVTLDDIERFARIGDAVFEGAGRERGLAREDVGVVASMQPTHATSDMPWAEQRVGPERLAGAYAWQRFLGAPAPLAFGSDFPVESTDPRLGLYAAVTRQDLEGQPAGGWLPDQRISVESAIRAFTEGAAWAGLQEHELGRLAPGYLCDLTVFGADPFEAEARALPELPVAATVIGGEIVFRN